MAAHGNNSDYLILFCAVKLDHCILKCTKLESCDKLLQAECKGPIPGFNLTSMKCWELSSFRSSWQDFHASGEADEIEVLQNEVYCQACRETCRDL